MPYSADDNSMMVANRSPRLRHLWIQCRWLNENPKIRNLTGNTVFRVRHQGIQGEAVHDFRYYLPPQTANFYKAAYEQKNVTNGANGKFDLFLYRLGQDEMTKKEYNELVPHVTNFNAIIVLRFKIVWFFKDHVGDGSRQWASNDEKLEIVCNFQNGVNFSINNRFWLEAVPSTNMPFSKIYLYFLPHHQFEGSTGNGHHFQFTVRAKHPINGVEADVSFNGVRITFGNNPELDMLYRYILGFATHDGANNPITGIAANEL